MKPGTQYWLRQTTREVQAFVSQVVYRIDVDTLHRDRVDAFKLNDIGRVHIQTAQPMFFDPYELNRETGSFILIDPHSNDTVAAGMIRGKVRSAEKLAARLSDGAPTARSTSPDVVWENLNISLLERESGNGHRAAVVWFTGLPGSGKSSIARGVERRLFATGCQTVLLDGDQVRHGLNGDLGFSPQDRAENIRRVGEVAGLFLWQGNIVLCAFVSPFRRDRERARHLLQGGRFVEVFVDTPLEECERRDPKGLYARARRGEIGHMTGVSSRYEAPEAPEIRVDTVVMSLEACVEEVVRRLRELGQAIETG